MLKLLWENNLWLYTEERSEDVMLVPLCLTTFVRRPVCGSIQNHRPVDVMLKPLWGGQSMELCRKADQEV
jgi:hypothetical protein